MAESILAGKLGGGKGATAWGIFFLKFLSSCADKNA
jgi:hypothetical protein